MTPTPSDTMTTKRSTNNTQYNYTTKTELIRMAQAADDLAARYRPDRPRWHAFRARAYEYRQLAQERNTK